MVLSRDIRASNCRDELNNTKRSVEEDGLERIEAKGLDEERAKRADATRGYSGEDLVSSYFSLRLCFTYEILKMRENQSQVFRSRMVSQKWSHRHCLDMTPV